MLGSSVATLGLFLIGIAVLSFIAGGLFISRKGLGSNPLRTLFRNNIVTWTVCIFITVQPSIPPTPSAGTVELRVEPKRWPRWPRDFPITVWPERAGCRIRLRARRGQAQNGG